MNNNEIWKNIAGYEGLYQVSDQGRVRSLARIDSLGHRRSEKILRPRCCNQYGHVYVDLYCRGRATRHTVHQLVAAAFLGPRPVGLVIDHRDSNPRNNAANNLRYVTYKANSLTEHAIALRSPHCLNTVVQQLDKNGNIVAEFLTVCEAARATSVSRGSICKVINGGRGLKSAGGFVWRRVSKQTGGSK